MCRCMFRYQPTAYFSSPGFNYPLPSLWCSMPLVCLTCNVYWGTPSSRIQYMHPTQVLVANRAHIARHCTDGYVTIHYMHLRWHCILVPPCDYSTTIIICLMKILRCTLCSLLFELTNSITATLLLTRMEGWKWRTDDADGTGSSDTGFGVRGRARACLWRCIWAKGMHWQV